MRMRRTSEQGSLSSLLNLMIFIIIGFNTNSIVIMSETSILNIGYIPRDWSGDRITCGDAESSNVKEISIYISENTATINQITLPIKHKDKWDSSSELWRLIAEEANNEFQTNESTLESSKVFQGWLYFTEEESLFVGAKVVFDEDDFGEFYNDDHQFNGFFYMRYQIEVVDGDDVEYLSEQGIVFK